MIKRLGYSTVPRRVRDFRLERHAYAPELNRLQYFSTDGRDLKVLKEWSTPGAQTIAEAKAKAGLPVT